VIQLTVSADAAGQRLDKLVRKALRDVPLSHVYKMFRTRKVRVNGARGKADQLVAEGDVVVIRGDEERLLARPEPAAGGATRVTFGVLHEDADVLAVDKPAGLAAHPGTGIEGATLVEMARAYLRTPDDLPPTEFKPSPAHRLDRDTSGCLIVAKRRAALRNLHEQLREGQAEKRYLALVCGKWDLGQKRIELPLATGERRGGERHVAVRSHGQMAVSTFRPVQFFGVVATLMEVEIGTGKTHQIRVHAAYAGHPVAGDDKYGDRECNEALRDYGLNRMFLHAASIGVTRPGTREPLLVSAPLGDDLKAVLDALVKAPGSRRGAARRRARSAAGR
jgi:23S rRNA pseudouridine955/2504/2580 synthase